MGKHLTKEELIEIENEARSNFDFYFDTNVIDGNATYKSIITITKNNHLIFIEGNSDTGFKHIWERHSFYSFKNYWKEKENGNASLKFPSKFHPNAMPFPTITKVADSVFDIKSKQTSADNREDEFDLYIAFVENVEYKLLTYKGTKIAHTLYPKKEEIKSERKLEKFAKGDVKAEKNFSNKEWASKIIIPYLNSKNITAYSIIFERSFTQQSESEFIQKHNEKGDVIKLFPVSQKSSTSTIAYDTEDVIRYQHANLKYYEDIIRTVDKYPS